MKINLRESSDGWHYTVPGSAKETFGGKRLADAVRNAYERGLITPKDLICRARGTIPICTVSHCLGLETANRQTP